MNPFFKTFPSALITLAALTACGGGGDNPPAGENKDDNRETAVATAKIGAALFNLAQVQASQMDVLGGELSEVSKAHATNAQITRACVSGSASVTLALQIYTITYQDCLVPDDNVKLNGVVRLNYSDRATIGMNTLDFDANMTALSMTKNGVTVQYDGLATVSLSSNNLLSRAISWSVPANQQLKAQLKTGAESSTFIYQAKTEFSMYNDDVKPGATSFSINGVMALAEAPGATLSVSTTSRLRGDNDDMGLFQPVAGSFKALLTRPAREGGAIAIVVEPQAKTTKVQADVGNDGSTDLSFEQPWSQLTGLK